MQHYSDRAFIERYPLSPKKIWKKMIGGVLASVVVFLLVGFELYTANLTTLFTNYGHIAFIMTPLCILALCIVINYLYQRAYIRAYYYNVTDKLLIIRKGVIAKQDITVPFERIQDVYVDQDLFDVLFGLYDVHISTATATSGVRAHIDGLDKQAAEDVRQLILSKIH